MASVNQENVELREEVGNLKEGMEKLTTMMNALLASQAAQDQAAQAQAAQEQAAQVLAAQNQAAQALAAQNQATQAQLTVSQSGGTPQLIPTIASGSTTQPLVTSFSAGDVSNMYYEGFRYPSPLGFSSTPQHYMPPGYPWGM